VEVVVVEAASFRRRPRNLPIEESERIKELAAIDRTAVFGNREFPRCGAQ
jgi:hypothetical protein